jgi:putative tryptophan/tyrosine transport system substrate-binding protein
MEIEAAARSIGQAIHVVTAGNERETEDAFSDWAEHRISELIVGDGSVLGDLRQQIVALAARHGFPAVYPNRFFTQAGGLMSYATNEVYRQIGIYAARILKGQKPGDLPVVQPTRFELVRSRPRPAVAAGIGGIASAPAAKRRGRK